jgi:para-nitrobenzyl esterase
MQVVVETRVGTVRGAVRGGIATWRGIPYARAPRFRPPEPVTWTGERDATAFGPVAMQSRDPRTAMMSGVTDKVAMAEDCLALNIYSPAADGNRRPVLVWIHGGAFVMGSGSQPLYNGTSFASLHDLVVVTFNYRLGVFGLLELGDRLGDDYAAGNVALLDQLAALRWVRDHIAAFGGDPDAITVMGESAGAVSVANLLAMPAARGLFQRAILQSGASGLSPPTRSDATAFTDAYCAELGVAPRALLDLPAEQLLAGQERVSRSRGLGAFTPYVDGVTVPRLPIDAIRAGDGACVPTLLGSNRDEWALFDLFVPGSTAILVAQLRGRLGGVVDRMHAAYLAARDDGSAERAWLDLVGEVAFRIPMIRLAEAQAKHAPVWMYRFDWSSTAFGGKLGAAHALELPFVWNVVDTPVGQLLLGADAGAQPLATAMQAAWAAFVRGGAPAADGLPRWPIYEPPRRATMIIDRESRIVDDPAGAQRALWP